ncbi:PHP domain-containing protein [candidate division KSB1 bacterium]|nr:PHP domain-containing protein [candidate division KSB1 bacterium]
MLRWFKADLHIHTVLSPCADLLMGPKNIIERAQEIGLHIIAITDHNSSENVEGVIKAAAGTRIQVIPGMELTTREEVHLLCLFHELAHLVNFQTIVTQHTPPGENDPDFFGPQYIVNEKNEIIQEDRRLLILSTDIPIQQAIHLVQAHAGMAIPAHVDRKTYSLINQLGFLPPALKFPALEISWEGKMDHLLKQYPELSRFPFIRSSDAHETSDMGRGFTYFYLEKPTLAEISMAFYEENGRKLKSDQIFSFSHLVENIYSDFYY